MKQKSKESCEMVKEREREREKERKREREGESGVKERVGTG